MNGPNRTIVQNQGPVSSDLGTPASTKPALGTGIFNATVGTSAEKVLSKSTNPRGLVRRVIIVNPSSSASLGYSTSTNAAPTLTSSVAGGGATDGKLIPPGGEVWFSLRDNADLYLAASGAGTAYQLTVTEV